MTAPAATDTARLARTDRYRITWTDATPPKPVLPDAPAHTDTPGQCAWLTSVWQLAAGHPITGAERQGLAGADAHVEVRRASAPPIRIEPISAAYSARRLVPMLGCQLLPTDGQPHRITDAQAATTAHVIQLLAGRHATATATDEAAGIIGTFLNLAIPLEGHTTYGPVDRRYEAAAALQHDPGVPPNYLIDANTGELVIRVSDLQAAARAHVGSSLPHGWVNGRMDALGWRRCTLAGFAVPGRDGRRGPHARAEVYRGVLPDTDETADAA